MLFNSPIKSPIIIHKIISNLNFLFPALYTFAPIYIYTVFMRKKNLLLLALLLGSAVSVNAQKGKVKLDFAGGFEMTEKEKGEVNGMNGFNVNADLKYYVNNRLYTLGTVFTSKVSGTENGLYTINSEQSFEGYTYNKMTNTMVGLGLGYDIIQSGKHTLYAQAAFGLASEYSEWQIREDQDNNPDNGYIIHSFDSSNEVDWGLIGKAGYNYQLTKLLSVGASYQVNYLCGYASHGIQAGLQLSF